MYSACPHGPHAEGRQTDCHSHKEHSSRAKNQIRGSWILQDHLSNELCKQIRHTWHYTAGPPIFHKKKFKNKKTKTCSEKSALKNPVWGSKQNWHTLPPAVCTEKKNHASIHRLLFFNSSGLKAAAHIPNIIGKEESRNISVTEQRGLSMSGHFSFVAFSSQQLPTYSLSGDISGVHQNIFLCSLHC